LSEISAYKDYFGKTGEFEIYDSRDSQCPEINECDLVWFFMGLYHQKIPVPFIHEYSSLSVAPFAKIKDQLKKIIGPQPSLRLFLNQYVKDKMSFNDNIPCLFRDMGVHRSFYNVDSKKEYDFVYCGAMDKSRSTQKLLKYFSTKLKNKTLLVIGSISDELYGKYKRIDNIIFTGRLSYNEVPNEASKAVYGIDYKPDIYPYSFQTSTKILEYCAMGLKIITTPCKWVDYFERKNDANFFRISFNSPEIDLDSIARFKFKIPDVPYLEWNRYLDSIHLVGKIKNVLSGHI
jgi:hypothetical protein